MERSETEKYNEIINLIKRQYSQLIRKELIIYGPASFKVLMLANCTYENSKNNPDIELEAVLGFPFRHFSS